MQTNNKDSKVSYTKGEWFVFNHRDGGKAVGYKHNSTFTIAKINGAFPLNENDEANAKLIAAAPELLEACRDAIAQVCNHEDGHKKQFQDAYNKLEAAIKKATEQ